MASDQLRKKWGTIFMGEREATPQQLDAMQEPLLRERAQHQQQEDYLARVRARAEQRAREILGAAYAERQKVLEEAGAEAQARVEQFTREAKELKAQAQAELAEAEAEHGKARDLREEAEFIRSNAHNEGFQAGMEQAGAELKEFRVDVGQMLGNMLRALEAQRHSLGEAWRDELAELARVAVEAGTGWILQAEHQRILQNLVFGSLQLLEDRATVSIRVHPDDEDTVSDLFRAARERVPELSQWIVNGDPSVEAGGLVAESVSGSVENLREHYREMVNGILEHLTLPPRSEEEKAGEEVSATAARESARLTQVVPEAAPVVEPEPELPVEPVDTMGQPELLPEHLAEHSAETLAADTSPESGPEFAPESAPGMAQDALPEQAAFVGQDGTGLAHDEILPASGPVDVAAAAESFEQGQEPAPVDVAAQPDAAVPSANASPEIMQDSMPEPGVQADEQVAESSPAPMAQPVDGIEGQPAQEQAPQPAHAQAAEINANPSLAELEDELFPLPEEETEHVSQSSSSVFVSGGFLPGSGNGQPG
ncbi:flagellar assembly protein FliH [Desulfovibrio sp. UIB00]|uniref:FliH/SctL family protein n=1 Tax=Desulfovibrio sp. UIB00 TaxID=2804314 RepID=UPI001F0EFAEA|nr:FliH/SctL family protein [Desulfovibrio sp. UIB00]MCH5144971.1 flagellar assembly protein FliH [Desulfovibrio sp. UIB00]